MDTPGESIIPKDEITREAATPDVPAVAEAPPPKNRHLIRLLIGGVGLLTVSFLGTLVFLFSGTITPQSFLDFLRESKKPVPTPEISVLGQLAAPTYLEAGASLFFDSVGKRYAYIYAPAASTTVVVVNKEEFEFPGQARFSGFAFSATGTRYAFGVTWPNVDVDQPNESAVIVDGSVIQTGMFSIVAVAFSPDAKNFSYAIMGLDGLSVYVDGVRETPAGITSQAILGSAIAWSHDGKRYAYLIHDGASALLVVNGQVVRTLDSIAEAVGFAPDGTLYAGGCAYTFQESGALVSKGCVANAQFALFDSQGSPVYAVPENPRYPALKSRTKIVYAGKEYATPCFFEVGVVLQCFEAFAPQPKSSQIAYSFRTPEGSQFGVGNFRDDVVFVSIPGVALSQNALHAAYIALATSSAYMVLDGKIIDEVPFVPSERIPFGDLQFSPEGLHIAYNVLYRTTDQATTELIIDGAPLASFNLISNLAFDEPRGRLTFNAIRNTEILHVDMPIPDRTFARGVETRDIARDVAFSARMANTAFWWEALPIFWEVAHLTDASLTNARIRIDLFSIESGRVITVDEPLPGKSATTTVVVPGLIRSVIGSVETVPEGVYRLQTTVYNGDPYSGVCGPGSGGGCSYAELTRALGEITSRAVTTPRSSTVSVKRGSFYPLPTEGMPNGVAEAGQALQFRWENSGGGAVSIELIPSACDDFMSCPAAVPVSVDAPNIGMREWRVPASLPKGRYLIRLKDQSRGKTVVGSEIIEISIGTAAPSPTPVSTDPAPTPLPEPEPKPTTPTPTPTPTPKPKPASSDDDNTPSLPPSPGTFSPF